uniref:Uncharacterized protein n=1 Tax=Arundo donax TaxID=35708 RepID=A0A0A9DW32_ARUDO
MMTDSKHYLPEQCIVKTGVINLQQENKQIRNALSTQTCTPNLCYFRYPGYQMRKNHGEI